MNEQIPSPEPNLLKIVISNICGPSSKNAKKLKIGNGSEFFPWDVLSFGTFCPLGHFVSWDVLSLGTFCPWDILSLGTFCPWDLMSEDVLSWNVLSLGTFCLGMFCLCTEISSTEILTEGRPGVPAQSLKFGNTGFARSLADETAESVIHKYSV